MQGIRNQAYTKRIIQSLVLVEDDPDNQFFFRNALKEVDAGIKASYVSNGNELLSLLNFFIPDILFLDLEMPVKNGLRCLVNIRNNPQTENLPVVACSATARHADIQIAYEMGAHLFLIKPSIFKFYVSALKAILALDWHNPEAIKQQYFVNGRYASFI